LVRAESRLHVERSCNIKSLSGRLLGLELLRKAQWSSMIELQNAKYFLQQFKLSKIL